MSEFAKLYRKMTRLACYVADQHVTKYSRDTVEDLVETVGWQAADDFFQMIRDIYGANVDDILYWISEVEVE